MSSALLVMSADYEMLMSRSPPTFSHHSPPAGFLLDYCNTSAFAVTKPLPPSSTTPRVINATSCKAIQPQQFPKAHKSSASSSSLSSSAHQQKRSVSCNQLLVGEQSDQIVRRPCLVIRDDQNENNSNTKKKVVFADDKGMSLTQVRVMTEPSNVPPLWSLRFLSQVTKGICAEPLPEPWEITFVQPASDYIMFRRRLDTNNVSLENIIVRESEAVVIGTVKVKNIAFKKEVIVRSTSNNWTTHEDTFCTFVTNPNSLPSTSAVYVLYDTFAFRLTLPPKSRRIEFCVCYRCENNEYWDNNSGTNYILVKKAQISPVFLQQKSLSNDSLLNNKNHLKYASSSNNHSAGDVTKYSEITQTNLDTWSEFASWTHLDTQGPYW